MRAILFPVFDNPCLEASRRAAFALARSVGGEVTCLQAVPLDVGYSEVGMGLPAQMIPLLRDEADGLRGRLKADWSADDTPREWVTEYKWPHQAIADQSPLHDIVVLGAYGGTEASRAAELAVSLRTPILLVPSDAGELDVHGSVVIAWNGSEEAANAVRAALPLLCKASSVILLTVDETSERSRMPVAAAAHYLALHGIETQIAEEAALEDGIAATIEQFARRCDARLMVMGAYGKSRLREFLLGGVSRSLLSEPPLPLFLSH